MDTQWDAAREVRKSCRQFAMLYYHFCAAARDALGEEAAFALVSRALLSLSVDRAGQLREVALAQGVPLTPEGFAQVTDIPVCGWTQTEGEALCPYAQTWLGYTQAAPWFGRFASRYCDVIDTTNIEVFSREYTHRITQNQLWGDACCDRVYEPSDAVREGRLTYEEEG